MTTAYRSLSPEALRREYAEVSTRFDALRGLGLALNMARGKPGKAQLDMASDMLSILTDPKDCVSDGTDVRNYGELSGLSAAKRLFADIPGCKPEECFIGGNASLTLMYDTVSKAYTHGMLYSEKPWCKLDGVKWLCPSPGYDRHFKITESFGFDMVIVPMTENGPDMDVVEEPVKDPEVKEMWCVPKYSNPDGIVYSKETVHRIAALKPAAPDFLLMWDNAYCVHEFDGDFLPFEDIISLCREAGNPDMVFEFAPTSKITLPGAGVSVMAASVDNQKYMQNRCVLEHLDKDIAPLGIASWQRPKGGYFVSVNTNSGLAKRTLELCSEAGVVMTGAGATFPYGKDPNDSNIRIAPSLPPIAELEDAMEVFCTCLRLAALEKLGA